MTSRANRQDERSDLSGPSPVPSCTPEGFLAWCAASLLKTPSWARTPSRNDSGCRGHRSVSTQAMQGSPPGTFGQEPPDPQTAPRGAVRCSDRCCADPLLKLEERSGISLGRGVGHGTQTATENDGWSVWEGISVGVQVFRVGHVFEGADYGLKRAIPFP